MQIDKNNVGLVEHNIAPLMRRAITLPITTSEGNDSGVSIYIAESAFGELRKPIDIRDIAENLGLMIPFKKGPYRCPNSKTK